MDCIVFALCNGGKSLVDFRTLPCTCVFLGGMWIAAADGIIYLLMFYLSGMKLMNNCLINGNRLTQTGRV